MSTYYLKKCGFQELGSIGDDGKINRGRYLLTSMNINVLKVFPSLTTTQKNDFALLPIIPLYSGIKVYCNFVYHNDKFHNSTATQPRNEYRLYLNNALEVGQRYFETGDIMIIRKDECLDVEECKTVYPMDLIKDKTSDLYKYLDKIISDSTIRGGYGLYDGTIPAFEDKYNQVMLRGEPNVEIDDSVTKRVTEASTDAISSLFNASNFRDFVMVGYENLCAITGTVIKYESYMNLEAAHIKPKSHGGLFLPNNGIALCRDIHWAFDKGFLSLNDNCEVMVHSKTTSDYLHSFNGQKIRTPTNPFFVPDITNIRYHRENVYGLFLTTGRL